MKCAITAQSQLGNNKILAQLKVYIVKSIHNMEKVVVLNMLIATFLNISIIALIVPFINLR